MIDDFVEFTLAIPLTGSILIRIIYSYYTSGFADLGGVTTSYMQLKQAKYEAINIFNNNYVFDIMYIDDTKLRIKLLSGDASSARYITICRIL